jgi:hypothetical protein
VPNLVRGGENFSISLRNPAGIGATVARSEKRAAHVKLEYHLRVYYCVTNKSRIATQNRPVVILSDLILQSWPVGVRGEARSTLALCCYRYRLDFSFAGRVRDLLYGGFRGATQHYQHV